MRWAVIGVLCCMGGVRLWAQQTWTAKDSLWLQRVLAGQDTVRLDPEVKRAIERKQKNTTEPNPTPQNTPPTQPPTPPTPKIHSTPTPLLAPHADPPITKDFSEYIGTDQNPHRKVPLNKLPPQVFWHHNPRFKGLPPVYESIQEELKRNPPKGPAEISTFY